MFGKKVVKTAEMDSIIGEQIKLIGKVKGTGSIRIDGLIEGDVDYKGDVILGETGRIVGNVECHSIDIAGAIKGNVKIKENLTLHTSGKLVGDMDVKNLVIHENAIFHGFCKMEDPAPKANNKAEKFKKA